MIDGKMFIFQSKPRHVTIPAKSMVLEKWALFWGFQHTFMAFLRRYIDGKMFIFQVNLGMWPCKMFIFKNEICSEGFNTHLWGFQEDKWENVHLSIKPRHVTPHINHLRKVIPLLRVSTHISGISKKINGKIFIFQANLGMWLLKSKVWEK